MKKSYCLILLILATQLASGWSLSPVRQECRKSYRVQGTGTDGQPRDFTMQLRRPKGETKGFDPVLEQNADEKYYSGYYQVIGPPTSKQNCAGLVMERLFGITNTYFDADKFVTTIIQNFARQVSGPYQAGDVVVFGANKHVAYVTGPGSTSSRARIVSKDNQESTVEGELTTGFGSGGFGNDPIKKKNGAPTVYRFVRQPSVTEVSPGDCDPAILPDLHVTIDVNEQLRGDLRALAGASVTLTLSNGEKIPGTAGADGKANFTIADNPPGRGAAARAGITVRVTLKGFYDKTDSFTSGGQDDRYVNETLSRTPDNPAEADPNIPPDTTKVQLADWEKRFKALEARVAAAEAKKKEFETKAKNAADNVGKVTQAEAKAREQLAELKKLKAAVDRVEQLCKDASKANAELESIVKTIEQKEKEATKLTDDLLKQLDNCSSADDLKRIRDGKTQLKKMVDDMGVTAKQVIKLNDELKRLETESMKDAPEILKGVDYRKGISEQEKIANEAFNAAMDDNNALTPLETQISTQRFSLSGEHSKLREDYPGEVPADVDKRLNDLNDRINNIKVSTNNDVVTIAGKLGNFAAITGEADQLISQYRSSICVIKPRQDLIDRITDSLTLAGLGLQSIARSDDKIKQCEDKLDCQSQIKKINELLDNGDLEGATSIIAQIKGGGCDTSAVEARWQQISDRISFDLATARNRWRDIASTCDYRGAYEAALVIQKQYPKHPWILKNFADIQRGYQAEQQIRGLVEQLVAADKARNYDEAERILASIDGIAAPFPCMVAESKKLRTQYGKGKAADPETDRLCRDLLAQIQAAIAGKRLVEASKKLDEAKQKCSNVSPDIFTALGTAQQQLDQAIQQAINDIQTNTGKCEYESALELAEQVQQLRPGALGVGDVAKLRQQAEAQKQARQYLQPGLEAIKQKDVKGAISSLRQALGVPNIPLCLRDQITKLLKELEKRQSFTDLTDMVQQATIKCDYNEAARLIGQIKLINPREQYITDWLITNEKILTDLQERERRALELVRQADAIATKAETVSTTEPVDFNNVSALGQQAMNLLTQADKEAPKCMQRQQMEQIRQRMLALSQRKKPEIAASIVLLIDTSGSMADNNKINQAKDAAKRAARQVSKTTEIAILNFDGDCGGGAMHVAAPFTTDVNTLLAAIGSLQPGGGTPMYISTAEAIEYAQKNGRGKSRNLILMSDGGDSCRDKQPQAAAAIRSSNIPVSTIGFDVGSNQQAQGDLSNLATMTGGRTFSASAADPREIIRAFNLAMLPSLLKDFDFAGGSAVANYFTQAKSMVQQQNISGALMMLQQANNLAPNSPNLNYNLSLLYEADDQLIPAVNHANNYLKLAPNAVDSADVQNRISEIQQELQKNPRVVMDSSGCRDILTWATGEREIAKRSGNASRIQAILEISISSQRGECDKARSQSADYKSRYR